MHVETDRLLLRPYRTEDALKLYAAKKASHDHLKPWMEWAQEVPALEKEKATIAHFHERMAREEEIALAIFLRDGTFVGSTGYFIRDAQIPWFEIGYWLDVRHVGQGYMDEAVKGLTAALFDKLAANRVEIRCHGDNHRSAEVARRLGYDLEGRLRNERLHLGKLADALVFAHTPESWEAFLAMPKER